MSKRAHHTYGKRVQGFMLEAIVKVNFALYALICFEAVALFWLTSLPAPASMTRQIPRRTLYLAVAAGLVCLIMVFVPDNHPGPSSLWRSQVMALLTPVAVVGAILTTVGLVVAVRRRMGNGRRHSELERARVARSKARRRGRR
jgi:H+/gluconate symporter-like permease